MLTDIYLHGELGKRFGTHWRLGVNSVGHAVHALEVIRPGFMQAIEELDAVVEGFHVQVGERGVGEQLLQFPNNGKRIDITPVLTGSDTKGIIQIIAGVVLIAAGVALAFSGFGAILGIPAAQLGLQIGLFGAAIALGGIARLLMSTPAPSSTDNKKQKTSYSFSGLVNTSGQGECVPILFGEMVVGSQVVSAGIEAVDTDTSPSKKKTGGGTHLGNQPPIEP